MISAIIKIIDSGLSKLNLLIYNLPSLCVLNLFYKIAYLKIVYLN